jgi:hypothetical protein
MNILSALTRAICEQKFPRMTYARLQSRFLCFPNLLLKIGNIPETLGLLQNRTAAAAQAADRPIKTSRSAALGTGHAFHYLFCHYNQKSRVAPISLRRTRYGLGEHVKFWIVANS